MRDYAKVSGTFWTGTTGKALKAKGKDAVIVALYLMSCPNSNMLGLYWLPRLYLEHETGLGSEGAREGLARACEAGFCQYDEASEVVWVVEMAAWQIADSLKPTDNRCSGVQREYDQLPENPFLTAFYERYAEAFHLTSCRGKAKGLRRASKAPTKPGTGAGAGAGGEGLPAAPQSRFGEFWSSWPKSDRKGGKADCAKLWANEKLEEQADAIVAHVKAMKLTAAWTKDGGQFIPAPLVYLRGRRWDGAEVGTPGRSLPDDLGAIFSRGRS